MATYEEVVADVQAMGLTLTALDVKLDEIRSFIAGLGAPQLITQEQLDQLGAMVAAAKAQTEAVFAETDALDE